MKVTLTGVCVPLTTEYGIPIIEPWYRPDPKSACIPAVGPMKLMMALEFGSTGEPEISWFQRLSLPKGRKPLRLAALSCAHRTAGALGVAARARNRPTRYRRIHRCRPSCSRRCRSFRPMTGLSRLRLPPQFAHASANASAPMAASNLVQEKFMPLLSQEIAGKPCDVRSCPAENRDMYS